MKKAIGQFLVALPFICVFVFVSATGGFHIAMGVFGLTGAIVGCIYGGLKLQVEVENEGTR